MSEYTAIGGPLHGRSVAVPGDPYYGSRMDYPLFQLAGSTPFFEDRDIPDTPDVRTIWYELVKRSWTSPGRVRTYTERFLVVSWLVDNEDAFKAALRSLGPWPPIKR